MFVDRLLNSPRRGMCARGAVVAFTAALSVSATLISLHPALAHSHSKYHAVAASRRTLTRTERSLMSRGAGFDAPAAQVTGQIATVTTDNAAIYAGREEYGRLLSRVDKGTPVVVTGQTDQYYAVMMSNHTLGFISKNDAQLQNLQVTTSGAVPDAASIQDASPLVRGLLQSAYNYLGVAPYVWGGNTIDGIDCSGFVKAVYSENGIKLPRTAAEQVKVGYEVPLRDVTQWMPGDRMYFQCHHSYIDHTGMYIGNGYFIHSSINHHGVDIDRVDATYYWNHLVAVRRSAEVIAAAGVANNQVSTGAPDYESDQE